MAFHLVNQDLGSLLPYPLATLFDGGEHRVAGHSPLTVGEATDTDVLWHAEAHTLHGVKNTDGRIVVDSEEGVGIVVAIEEVWRYQFGVLTVVADAYQALVVCQATLQQGILVAVETVLRDFELHGRAIERDTAASGVHEVGHGIESPHIVVDNHAAGVHARTDTVVEHDRDARVYQPLEVLVALCILSLRHDDTTHFLPEKHLADAGLALILFSTQCHHDVITASHGRLFDTCQDAGEIVVCKLWHDDTDNLRRHYPGVAQRLAHHIRIKIMFARVCLNHTTPLLTDAR